MKVRITTLAVGMALVAGTVLMAVTAPGPAARAAELPGMCNGRSDPNLLVIAHANGVDDLVPSYLLNVTTDASGNPSGSLIFDRGASRLMVKDWCRAWQHLPGQPSGGNCEMTYPEGAITAHAVGLGTFRDGRTVLVRTDVRKLADGDMLFRLRYRPWDGTAGMSDGDGCDDASWTRVPPEGWYPLDQMYVRVKAAST